MAKPQEKASAKPAGKSSRLRMLLGWVVVPGLILAGLFLAGVHVGARHPQMGLSRAVLWVMSAEPQLGPATESERQPLARRLILAALPSTTHSLEAQLSPTDLEALVASGAGPTVDKLDCAKVCKIRWTAEHADRELISVDSCELTQATASAPAKIECEAKVQRALTSTPAH